MSDEHRSQEYDELDSLTPYEVAVLMFTSPRHIGKDDHSETEIVTLTAKESYLWAGAAAHVAVRRPELEPETIALMFERSVGLAVREREMADSFHAPGYRRGWSYSRGDIEAVDRFLRDAGLIEGRGVRGRGVRGQAFAFLLITKLLSRKLLLPVSLHVFFGAIVISKSVV